MSVARVLLLAALEEERRKLLLRHRRELRASSNPLQLPERTFQQLYRLDKACFTCLCNELRPYMSKRLRRHGVPLETRVLAAISFYASGTYQKKIAVDSNLGLSQSTMSECLEEVTEALNQNEILRKYIKFPSNTEEGEQTSKRFMELHEFPGVIGCLDGTHVAIIRPKENDEEYFNKKNYHSLNVLIICDADLQITYVNATYPGASHDSYVWKCCPINIHLQRLNANHEFWLIGDSGYPQTSWLMTPITETEPGSAEEYYTDYLCRVHNTVERTNRVLKARWRCLLSHRTMHYSPIKAGRIVNACVVLHNICNAAGLPVPHLSHCDRRLDRERQIVERVIDQNAGSRDDLVQRLWRQRS